MGGIFSVLLAVSFRKQLNFILFLFSGSFRVWSFILFLISFTLWENQLLSHLCTVLISLSTFAYTGKLLYSLLFTSVAGSFSQAMDMFIFTAYFMIIISRSSTNRLTIVSSFSEFLHFFHSKNLHLQFLNNNSLFTASAFILLQKKPILYVHALTFAFIIIQKFKVVEKPTTKFILHMKRISIRSRQFIVSLEILYRTKIAVQLFGTLLLCTKAIFPLLAIIALKHPFIRSSNITSDIIMLGVFMWNLYTLLNPISPDTVKANLFKVYLMCALLVVYAMVVTRTWLIQEHIVLFITFLLVSFDMSLGNHKLLYNIRKYWAHLLHGSRAEVSPYHDLISIEDYNRRVASMLPPEEHNNESEDSLCRICMDKPLNCVLLPCAHVVGCLDCINKLPEKICPICRKNIHQISKLYFC